MPIRRREMNKDAMNVLNKMRADLRFHNSKRGMDKYAWNVTKSGSRSARNGKRIIDNSARIGNKYHRAHNMSAWIEDNKRIVRDAHLKIEDIQWRSSPFKSR